MHPYYESVNFVQNGLPILIYKLSSMGSKIERINITNGHETDYFNMSDCKEISHWHNSLEILYYFDDAGMIINGDYYSPCKEDILLVDSFDIHKDPDDKMNGHYVFLIDPTLMPLTKHADIRFPKSYDKKWLKSNGEYENHRRLIAEELLKIIHFFECLDDKSNRLNVYELYSQVFMLFAKLQNYMQAVESNYVEDKMVNNQREILKRIYSYVSTNFSREITLKEISELVGFTENYFCKFIKTSTNQTFLEFLNSYRCQIARNKMEQSDLSVTTIALESGFSSVSYFSKVFKKNYGLGPREYRKNYSKS